MHRRLLEPQHDFITTRFLGAAVSQELFAQNDNVSKHLPLFPYHPVWITFKVYTSTLSNASLWHHRRQSATIGSSWCHTLDTLMFPRGLTLSRSWPRLCTNLLLYSIFQKQGACLIRGILYMRKCSTLNSYFEVCSYLAFLIFIFFYLI